MNSISGFRKEVFDFTFHDILHQKPKNKKCKKEILNPITLHHITSHHAKQTKYISPQKKHSNNNSQKRTPILKNKNNKHTKQK